MKRRLSRFSLVGIRCRSIMMPVISTATKLRKKAFSKVEISPAMRTQTDIIAKLSAASTINTIPFDLLLILFSP